MRYQKLRELVGLVFSSREVAHVLSIQYPSAKLLCHRYWKREYLIRLKRDVYVLDERWKSISADELFQVSNMLQTPSYISLTSILSYSGYSTQLQQEYVESISKRRSWERSTGNVIFKYFKLADKHYFGFRRIGKMFIAEPEKALADALYLTSIGRYNLDFSALEYSKIDQNKLYGYLNEFPEKTITLWDKHA